MRGKKLSCGGVGCCHEGRPHRHCEHCGVVVLTGVQPQTIPYPGMGNQPTCNPGYTYRSNSDHAGIVPGNANMMSGVLRGTKDE